MIDFIRDVIERFSRGKAPAYVFGFYMQTLLLFVLAYTKPDTNWVGFAAALAPINAAFYGGGAWALQSKRKYSNGSSEPATGS